MNILKMIKIVKKIIKNFIFSSKTYLNSRTLFNSIYDFKLVDDNGHAVDLVKYKGKKLLIVNTASACRYTRQYDDLETLSQKFGNKLEVVAFPCNDFGNQEQGSNEQINEFCRINYGVSFKVMPKTKIIKSNESNVFYWLSHKSCNGWNDQVPMWNFWKFLIDEEGKLMAIFSSRPNPLNEKLISLL